MDHVGQRTEWRANLHRQHELAQDFARARAHHGGPDEHSSLAIADELKHPAVKVVDVAASTLSRVA